MMSAAKGITRADLMKKPHLLRKSFGRLPPPLKKWVTRTLTVRGEGGTRAWDVWRQLVKIDAAHARKYPTYSDPVPGRGYNLGGQPANVTDALLKAWLAAGIPGAKDFLDSPSPP